MNTFDFALGAFAASALALSPAAQFQTTTLPANTPVQRVSISYDLNTGAIVPASPQTPGATQAPQRGVFPTTVADVICFENLTSGTNLTTGLAGEEWIDWGVKDCAGSDAITRIELLYATGAIDASMGGPGAALELALYEGTTGFGAALGSELIRLPLLGLPAGDGTGFFVFAITIDFIGGGIVAPNLADGKIGWGFTFLDGLTGPMLVPVTASAFGPDTFGYEADIAADGFVDISTTGTDITGDLSGLDDGGTVVPIGFDFDFYGTAITSIGASTNGYLADGGTLSDFTPACIDGASSNPGRIIAPAFQDLRLNEHGSMHTEMRGEAPCRSFVVQWTDVGAFQNSAASVTMQAELFESTNAIEFHYGPLVDGPTFVSDGSEAAIGVEDTTLGSGLSIGCGVVAGGTDTGTAVEGQSYRITQGRENENGTVDAFDRYAAPAMPGGYLTTSFFIDGGTMETINLASFDILLVEEDGTCATAENAPFGVPANPDIFTSATAPILGGTWLGDVDATGFPGATETIMLIAADFGICSGGGACPTVFGDLLIDPATIIATDTALVAGGVSQHVIEIPKILDKCGEVFSTQVLVVDPTGAPALTLTNAIDVQLGF